MHKLIELQLESYILYKMELVNRVSAFKNYQNLSNVIAEKPNEWKWRANKKREWTQRLGFEWRIMQNGKEQSPSGHPLHSFSVLTVSVEPKRRNGSLEWLGEIENLMCLIGRRVC